MDTKLLTIANQFALEGTIAEIKPLGEASSTTHSS